MNRLATIVWMVFLLLYGQGVLWAAKPASVGNGLFRNTSTWSTGLIPSGGDSVFILDGHLVEVDDNRTVSGSPLHIVIRGTLRFTGGGAKLKLPAGSSVTVDDGGSITRQGGGSSQILDIGTATVYSGSMGTVSGPMFTDGSVALPVTWSAFQVQEQSGGVLLQWELTSEDQNDRFVIERADGVQGFREIGSVQSLGNTQAQRIYTFLDKTAPRGTLYYRIRQVDLNGAFSFSGIRQLNRQEEAVRLQLGPNPVQGILSVTLVAPGANLRIFNANGVLVLERALEKENEIDCSWFLPGAYYYQVVHWSEGWEEAGVVLK